MENNPEKEKIKMEALELYQYSQNYWQANYDTRLRQCYKAFKRITDPDYPLNSNLFIPYCFANVQTALARLVDAVFASRNLVAFLPTPKAPMENCRKLEFLINYQLEKMNAFWSFYSIFQQSLIFGSGFGKLLWNENQPVISPLDCFEVLFDPSCRGNLQEAEWIIHRKITTRENLDKMIQAGIYQAEKKELDKLSADSKSRKEEILGNSQTNRQKISKKIQGIEILECWLGDYVITIAGQETVLRLIPKPYTFYPFVQLRINPFPNEPLGEGLIAPALDLQKEINNQRNLRLDLALRVLRPQWKIYGEIDEEELAWVPDGIIHLGNPADLLEPLIVPNTSAAAFNEEARAYLDIDRAMGITDILRGETSPTGRETATSVMTRFKTGANRSSIDVYAAGKMIEEITRFMIEMNRTYLKEEKWLDPQTQKISSLKASEILGSNDYQFVPICNTAPLKEIQRQQLLNFYNLLKNEPAINRRNFIELLLDAFEIQEKDKILLPQNQPTANSQQSTVEEQNLHPLPPQNLGEMMGQILKEGVENRE